jgi:hypothetical protein
MNEMLQHPQAVSQGNALAQAQFGAACRAECRIQDAIAHGREAVRLDPTNADYLVALSLAYVDADEFGKAKNCLIRALGLQPDHADGHLAMAQILLAEGHMEEGWREYEWRNLTEAGKAIMPKMTSMRWNGMEIPDGRLLIVGDQGYGDTIQFARYIPAAKRRVKEIVFGCSSEMRPLFENFPGIDAYYDRWDHVPPHAAHCHLSSLPYLVEYNPLIYQTDIPYLGAETSRLKHWENKLGKRSGAKRVGLAWSGRPTHPNDKRRSMRLKDLLPLSEISGVEFVSLQKPIPEDDQETVNKFPGMVDLSDEMTDFGETAAILCALDGVITIDTAVAHLAGAMGVKTHVMVAKAADWRWGLSLKKSLWYPTVTILRQEIPGDWTPVIEQARQSLIHLTS